MKKLKNEDVVRHGGWVLHLPNSRSRKENRDEEIQHKMAEKKKKDKYNKIKH